MKNTLKTLVFIAALSLESTSYTFSFANATGVVSFSNVSAITATLGQAGTASFPAGWFVDVQNTGAGTLTITPTTSTIDGAATLALTTGCGAHLVSDGANWASVHSCGGSGGGTSTLTWTQAGSPAGTLSNSWTNVSGRDASYAKGGDGIVHLRGAIAAGTTTSATVLFNLPARFRPLSAQDFIVAAYCGADCFEWAWVSMQTNGDLQFIRANAYSTASSGGANCQIAPPTASVSISGLTFPTN
jgi:hypothetical protein